MLKIDRTSNIPVPVQLAEQLRYRIASGAYNIGDLLPATRVQAHQLGVSFHTVRKAYRLLADEGLLEAEQGRGYRVSARSPLSNEERLEQGAAIVRQTLQRLVGLGLDEAEIEYLVQDQLAVLDAAVEAVKSVFVAPYQEMAEHCAAYIAERLEIHIEPAVPAMLDHHQDADFFFCLPRDVRMLSTQFPRIDALATTVYLSPDALDRIARLFSHEALGLVTSRAETIPHLMAEIQRETGFEGQIFASSLEDGTAPLHQFIDQTDLVVYTPQTQRRIMSAIRHIPRRCEISHQVSEDSIRAIQRLLPSA